MKKLLLLTAVATTTLLAACGGNDNPTPLPIPVSSTAAVPASASASIDGMVSYLTLLVAVKNDNVDEPVDVSAFAPPVSNTTEPAALPTLQ